jgi:hypothetical protein
MIKSNRILQMLFCLLLIFIFVFGCKGTDDRQINLVKGIGLIRTFTSSSPVNKVMDGQYQAQTPEGMVMLYHASADPNTHPNVYADRQSLQPWSLLVLPGNKERTLIVEGYGDDLQKPIIVEEIVFK